MIPEFVDLMTKMQLAKGKDQLTAQLLAILYASSQPLSLSELAEKTGYSLSAVSTAMKFLITLDLRVKRVRQPGSRQAFFVMEKDLIGVSVDLIKESFQQYMSLEAQLPAIIKKYQGKPEAKKELAIVRQYYQQVLKVKKAYATLAESLEKLR